MRIRTLFALLFVASFVACAAPGCSSGSGRTTSTPDPMWRGPAFDASIEMMESQPPQYAVRYQTTVPTGGWEIVTDDAMLVNGVVTLKITLIKPGRNEIVTQALETLRDQYMPGREQIRVVTILARQHERGSTPSGEYAPALTVRR